MSDTIHQKDKEKMKRDYGIFHMGLKDCLKNI